MVRRTTGTLRGLSAGGVIFNLEDIVYANGTVVRIPQRTTGVTLLDKLDPIFPPTAEKVELLSFAVSAELALGVPDRQGYGTFGKVVTGLTQIGQETSSVDPASGNPVPWALGASLPADLTLVTDLWDPQTDRCPPPFTASAQGGFTTLPVGATLTLPSPVPVFQGADIFMGIWALPSILACSSQGGPSPAPSTYLLMLRGQYTLIYDDGS